MNFNQKINSHIVGIVMREAVRRACVVIRKERFNFEFQEKIVDYKVGQDFVSSADKHAQEIYLDLLKRNFPEFGIIAEEDDLFTEAQTHTDESGETHRFYFTIDPLDGTKAFIRKQSDGYSSMLGLIHETSKTKEVISACIGDPMTGEMYYTRAESPRVHLLSSERTESRILGFDSTVNPKDSYILMRENASIYSPIIQKLSTISNQENRFFKDAEIQGGSIGIGFAKLWKGQYAALVLKAGDTTVWDTAPCVGISMKLGFVPMIVNDQGVLEQSSFTVSAERKNIPQKEMIVVHQSLVPKILAWQENNKNA